MVKFLDLVSSPWLCLVLPAGQGVLIQSLYAPLALQLLGTGRTPDLRSASPLRVIHCCLVTCFHLEVHFTIHLAAWSCGLPSSSRVSWVTLRKLLPLFLSCTLSGETLSVCLLALRWKVLVKTFYLGCQERS